MSLSVNEIKKQTQPCLKFKANSPIEQVAAILSEIKNTYIVIDNSLNPDLISEILRHTKFSNKIYLHHTLYSLQLEMIGKNTSIDCSLVLDPFFSIQKILYLIRFLQPHTAIEFLNTTSSLYHQIILSHLKPEHHVCLDNDLTIKQLQQIAYFSNFQSIVRINSSFMTDNLETLLGFYQEKQLTLYLEKDISLKECLFFDKLEMNHCIMFHPEFPVDEAKKIIRILKPETGIRFHPSMPQETILKLLAIVPTRVIVHLEPSITLEQIKIWMEVISIDAGIALHRQTSIEIARLVASEMSTQCILYIPSAISLNMLEQVMVHARVHAIICAQPVSYPELKDFQALQQKHTHCFLMFHPQTEMVLLNMIAESYSDTTNIILHPRLPIRSAENFSYRLNVFCLLHALPNTSMLLIDAFMKYHQKQTILFPYISLDMATLIAGFLKKDGMLLLSSFVEMSLIEAIVKKLSDHSGVYLEPFTEDSCISAQQALMHYQPYRYFLMSGETPIEMVKKILPELKPNTYYMIHPMTPVDQLQDYFKSMPTGSIIAITEDHSQDFAGEICKHARKDCFITMHSDTAIDFAVSCFKYLAEGAGIFIQSSISLFQFSKWARAFPAQARIKFHPETPDYKIKELTSYVIKPSEIVIDIDTPIESLQLLLPRLSTQIVLDVYSDELIEKLHGLIDYLPTTIQPKFSEHLNPQKVAQWISVFSKTNTLVVHPKIPEQILPQVIQNYPEHVRLQINQPISETLLFGIAAHMLPHRFLDVVPTSQVNLVSVKTAIAMLKPDTILSFNGGLSRLQVKTLLESMPTHTILTFNKELYKNELLNYLEFLPRGARLLLPVDVNLEQILLVSKFLHISNKILIYPKMDFSKKESLKRNLISGVGFELYQPGVAASFIHQASKDAEDKKEHHFSAT